MEITIKDLLKIRDYFGYNDKSPFKQFSFTILDCLIKRLKVYEDSDKILKPNELQSVSNNEQKEKICMYNNKCYFYRDVNICIKKADCF